MKLSRVFDHLSGPDHVRFGLLADLVLGHSGGQLDQLQPSPF